MLSEADLNAWCKRLGLNARCCEIVADARSRPPTRRVGGGRSNVSGRYPSRKMAATIQFESHRVELPVIYELEHDPSVLEYYDQPPSIPLFYESGNGRRLSVVHTPDFFVLRTGAAGWEECKAEQDLEKLAEKSPNRYRRDSNGGWLCPAGESHAKEFGLYYRVRSSATINWTLQQNLQFLEDYFRCDGMVISPRSREVVTAEIARQPGLPLTDLIQRTKDAASRDDIYFMIVAGEIFADLSAAAISQPAEVAIFSNAELAAAFRRINGSPIAATTALGIRVEPGQSVSWDGTAWRIVNVGDSNISLLGANGALTELPRETLDRLLSSGSLKNAAAGAPQLSEAARILNGASEADLREANKRFDLVKRHINGEPLSVSARTIRFWTARYRAAQANHGSGYLGLLPRVRSRGNRTARFSQDARALTEEWIAKDYESLKQRSRRSSWALLKARCEEQNLTAPSYKTFCLWVRRRPAFERTLKRQGQRAAYAHAGIYLELNRTTPRHGDRPFEICHIDHTELDVELVCSLGCATYKGRAGSVLFLAL